MYNYSERLKTIFTDRTTLGQMTDWLFLIAKQYTYGTRKLYFVFAFFNTNLNEFDHINTCLNICIHNIHVYINQYTYLILVGPKKKYLFAVAFTPNKNVPDSNFKFLCKESFHLQVFQT